MGSRLHSSVKHLAYVVPLRTTKGLVAGFKAAETMVDDTMIKRVREMLCGALPFALKWTEAASSSWFYHLIAFTIGR
jgi:hypothetical protein